MIDTSKVIHAPVGGGRYTVTAPIVKEDYGLYLLIEGLELPSTYEVDFSNSEHNGTSVTMIGNADGVLIPSQFISSGKDVFAFLYHVGADYGRTVYKFRIPNKLRPDRTNEEPTPEQQSVIDQAISALNSAVAQTAQDVIDADASAQSASDDADRAEEAKTDAQNYASSANTSSDAAYRSASSAQLFASQAETSAQTAEQIKDDVESMVDDAQGYATASEQSAQASANSASQASASATSASQSASSAQGYAQASASNAESASASAQSADASREAADESEYNAQVYAENAQASATASAQSTSQSAQIKDDVESMVDDAHGYASASAQSASASANSASDAQGYAQGASASAQSASGYATQAQTSAQTASTKASEASTSASTASAKATESVQSASQALTYKTDAESAKTASQTAQGLAESARDLAQGYAEDAQGYAEDAQASAEGISASASQIAQNTADILKTFPTDTASGAVASFSDGADDLPLKSLVVDINPVQDLHGYDSPYPAGGGKNLLYVPNPETVTINGVTWTCNQDGSVTISGTATGASTYRYIPFSGGVGVSFDGDYKFVCFGSNIPTTTFQGGIRINTWFSVCGDRTTAITGASGQIQEMWFQVKAGQTLNTTIYPMIYKASEETPTAWSPYENICPISGWTEVDVEQSGVNVWDEEWEVGTINNATGVNENDARYIRSKNYCTILPSTSYCIKPPSTELVRIFWYDAEKNFISNTVSASGSPTVVSSPSNAKYFKFKCFITTYNHDISINYPSSDHDYHPYTGRSITIDLGQTVYGGKLDVLSGELTVDRAMVDLGTLDWVYNSTYSRFVSSGLSAIIKPSDNTKRGNIVCSLYKTETANHTADPAYDNAIGVGSTGTIVIRDTSYTDATAFKAMLTANNAQLVYELAEPIEIQLSANQLNSLYGVNNIWADSGDTEAVYRADTKLFIERLTAPDSADMIADANITSGQYFMVGNSLYKATANIANGAQIIVGTNCIRKSLSEALNEINA